MSGRPWYKRYPVDFIHGTMGLTLEEKGAYGIVLDLIYDRGGPIVDDARYIAGVCNCSLRKWSAIRDRLISAGKIEVIDGKISNRRAEKEIENATNSARERAESGAKGGRNRSEKTVGVSESNGLDQAELKHTRAFQKPDTRGQNNPSTPNGVSPPSRDAKRGSRVDGFEPDLAVAAELGLTPERATLQAEKFLDYWRAVAGQKGVKLDWPATWRNWIRSEVERNGAGASKPSGARNERHHGNGAHKGTEFRSAFNRIRDRNGVERPPEPGHEAERPPGRVSTRSDAYGGREDEGAGGDFRGPPRALLAGHH